MCPPNRPRNYPGTLCGRLIIEFVPKADSQVERMLSTREDIFGDHEEAGVERGFGEVFDTQRTVAVEDSRRTLYLMSKKDSTV